MKNETLPLPWPDAPLSHRIPRYQSLWIGGFSQEQHYYDLNGARHRTTSNDQHGLHGELYNLLYTTYSVCSILTMRYCSVY